MTTGRWLVVAALAAELPRGVGGCPGLATHVLGRIGIRERERLPLGFSALIITGTCGSLAPDVPLGSLVMPQRLLRQGLGLDSLEPDAGLRHALLAAAASEGLRVAEDALVEATGLIDEPSERARLAKEHSAGFVDMESVSLALEAEERGIPWAVLRLVSDSPEHPLTFLGELLGDSVSEQPSGRRVALALMRRPWHLPRLAALGWAVHVGRGAVGRILLGCVPTKASLAGE